MATTVQWAKCWLLLSIVRIINTAGDGAENCIEFCGLVPGENSTEIEENNYINLTVHLNDENVFHIKVSHQQNILTVDLCKFVRSTTCDASDSSNATSYCRCLNNHTVQFLKKANSSDSGLYTWKWRDCKTQEKQRDIFIKVKQGNRSDDTQSAATTTTIVCVLLAVVVTATAGVVFWMRNKVTCSIEVKDCGRYYRSRGSEYAADNQVNDQAFNDVENPHSSVVIDSTANHSYDPNYAEVNDLEAIQQYDPNYADIKEQDKSQPPDSSYNEINTEKRSNDLPNAIVKKQGMSQSVDPTYPSVNSQNTSQPLDPDYSDIKEPTLSHSYDPNHSNDKEHDKNPNYDPNYADIIENKASQPPDPFYSDVKEQHSNQSDDPYDAEFKVENSKTDDHNYAHVKKKTMRDLDDAHVKTEDTNQPEDRLYADVKKQDENLAAGTTYPHVKGQDKEQQGDFAFSPKNNQTHAQPHNPTYVQDTEDASERGDYVYNHLHDIRQHDDPNYSHIETNTRQLADPTFQQVKGHNDLSYPNVKEENTSKEDGLIYDHIKQQDMSQPGHFHVDKEDTTQSDDNYDHLINCSGVLVKVGSVP